MIRPSRGAMIDSCIAKFQQLNINCLAIDFDQTILDIHTGGRWTGTVTELTEHVRSEFRQLIHACCENNIHVAIVTFSAQTKIVRGVIEAVVGPEYASRIPVRGRDRSWSYQGQGSQEGKQAFIASAVEELEHYIATSMAAAVEQDGASALEPRKVEINKNTTVLIDDDAANIKCALEDGTRAVWFNPNKPHHLLRDLSRLV